MTIKDLVNITNQCTNIVCFNQYANGCDGYSKETAKFLDDKEVVDIYSMDKNELAIYYQ